MNIDKARQQIELEFGQQRIKSDEPLQEYNPHFSGKAKLFVIVNTPDEIKNVIAIARQYRLEFSFLESDNPGQANNIGDIVMKNNARHFDILARKGKIQAGKMITDYALVEAQSGVTITQLVRYTIDQELGGIEEGLGLVGTIGSLFETNREYVDSMNSRGIIQSLKILDLHGQVRDISSEDFTDGLIVLSVIFKLVSEDKKVLWLKAGNAAKSRGIEDYINE